MNNNKKKALLTGAAKGMCYESLKQMVNDGLDYEIIALDLPGEKTEKKLMKYKDNQRVTILLGDLTNYLFVKNFIKGYDIIIHIAGLVPPIADYYPKKCMKVNYGSNKISLKQYLNQNKKKLLNLFLLEQLLRLKKNFLLFIGEELVIQSNQVFLITMPYQKQLQKDWLQKVVQSIGLV